ncbi:MAG TPA: IS1182 family transposase [Beijerinckiaceae bacterium]|nr:IS1182 family transposase [Beijerinckiaceae bacterium]
MSLHPMPIGEIPNETMRVARAAFPKGTLATRLRDEFADLFEDADFHALYPSRGQPGLAPWRLALVTVFQFVEQLSDRRAADAVRARIDWKYALGLELTDPGFHFSVLAEFRARLVAGRAEHLLLDKMLERFKQRGLVKARGKQRTDSTHVLAAVHDLHLLELVVETLRATLDDLAAVVPDWLRTTSPPAWFERYGRRVEEYRLPKGQEKREAFALAVGEDGFLLLAALDGPTVPAAAREVPMVRTLREVWRVHYAHEAGRLRWRSAAELPSVAERIQSPYDPEAHFSIKRQLHWTGYKVHVTETCDDDMAQVITDVTTCPSMRPDMTSTAGIHERLAAKGLLPAEHFVDSGYVDAELLASSQRDHGLSLEGPVRGVSSRQIRAGQGYSLPHFRINWDDQQVTCPQGKTSIYWRPLRLPDGSLRIQVQFSRSDCAACAARTECASPKAARRVMQFHHREEFEALRAARARTNDPAWLERYHKRAGVEGTLSQGVRAFGMRQSRYIGLAKTGLQETCTAVAMNVSRVIRWLDGVPRAKTRTTRFAALAQPV